MQWKLSDNLIFIGSKSYLSVKYKMIWDIDTWYVSYWNHKYNELMTRGSNQGKVYIYHGTEIGQVFFVTKI